jgi:hypothetical protein
LNELGIPEEPSRRINMALVSLEAGHSPIDIMRRYQVVVVFHGSPKPEEIQALRQLCAERVSDSVQIATAADSPHPRSKEDPSQ